MYKARQDDSREKVCGRRTGFNLPTFGIVMKVGPHSGMSLDEIAESKLKEESLYGVHYWGYSGTLCRPHRVLEFVNYVLSLQSRPPDLLLLKTDSQYKSPIGKTNEFSSDNRTYIKFRGPVQLQGAEFAFVCKNLRRVDCDLLLDNYVVVGGKNAGQPLSRHLRHRVNKSFVRLNYGALPNTRSLLAYTAQVVEPYVLWLKE